MAKKPNNKKEVRTSNIPPQKGKKKDLEEKEKGILTYKPDMTVADIAIVSDPTFGVIVILSPAVKVRVSLVLSATIVVSPTLTLANAFWFFSALLGA